MHPVLASGAGDSDVARKTRNWKLIVDPQLQKGGQKVYRTEGVVAGVSLVTDSHAQEADHFSPGLLSCRKRLSTRRSLRYGILGPDHLQAPGPNWMQSNWLYPDLK